jgi:hypothetical protein
MTAIIIISQESAFYSPVTYPSGRSSSPVKGISENPMLTEYSYQDKIYDNI